MLRTFRYPLHPTVEQEVVLDGWLVRACSLYNCALEERREAWRKQRHSVTRYDQQKSLTQIRAEDPEYEAVPVVALRSPIYRVDRAMQAFFRRAKSSKKPGFPRFRSRFRYDSVGCERTLHEADERHVHVPKLGLVRFNRYRPLRGEVRSTEIKRDSTGAWWVCFSVDLGVAPEKRPVRSDRVVGVDVGLETFATLSDGGRVENPRFFRAAEDVLARRQRALATKKRRSRSRERARKLVAKAHLHVRNQRLDHARKVAVMLFGRYDLIAYEALNIAGMTHGTLGKSIHDAGWRVFIQALTSKAEEAGLLAVAVDPRGTTRSCSRCGATGPSKGLGDREHVCDACGCRMGRDHNAALNIRARGLRVVSGQPRAEASEVSHG